MKSKVSFLVLTSYVGIMHKRLGSLTQHLIGAKTIILDVEEESQEKAAEEIFQKFFTEKYRVENLRNLRVILLSCSKNFDECHVNDEDPFTKKVEEILLEKITVFKESLKE